MLNAFFCFPILEEKMDKIYIKEQLCKNKELMETFYILSWLSMRINFFLI